MLRVFLWWCKRVEDSFVVVQTRKGSFCIDADALMGLLWWKYELKDFLG